jgi:predicted pyridoxine 5'-phosphate oxidase superfamily flavin-nucleotide-binding protein
MVKMHKSVQDTFREPFVIKILGTVDAEGKPNSAYVGSLFVVDDETLGFADTMMVKTKQNLEKTKMASVLVYTPSSSPLSGLLGGMSCYQVKGTFGGWQTSGPLYEEYNNTLAVRLNNTTNAKAIGLIKVEEVYLSMGPIPGKRIA